jgi:hypothetical protein
MTIFQPQVNQHKPLFTMLLIGTHLGALTMTLAFIWLAWDVGESSSEPWQGKVLPVTLSKSIKPSTSIIFRM